MLDENKLDQVLIHYLNKLKCENLNFILILHGSQTPKAKRDFVIGIFNFSTLSKAFFCRIYNSD
jgi:hypothetical protein